MINPPGGKKFSFTTRRQSVKQHTWDNFDSARFYQSDRCVAFTTSCSHQLLDSTVLSMRCPLTFLGSLRSVQKVHAC